MVGSQSAVHPYWVSSTSIPVMASGEGVVSPLENMKPGDKDKNRISRPIIPT